MSFRYTCNGVRPLYFHGSTLYCSRFNQIVTTEDFGRSFSTIGRLKIPRRYKILLNRSALLRRVLRLSVYRLRVADNGNIVCVFKGGIYLLRKGETEAHCVHPILRGSRPVSLASKPGGLIVWGEYHGNRERGKIAIFGSPDCGETWQPVYTFAAGSIRHIHGITYDEFDDCFWICTGDHDGEEQLLRADANFQNAEIVLQGGQENRFYSVVATPYYLLAPNDSPNADNYVRRLHKRTREVSNLVRIDNSSFYSCVLGGWYFCATNAEEPEPDSPLTFERPNDISASHVWMIDIATGRAKRILSFPVDKWYRLSTLPKIPSGLFQYSRIYFPDGDNPSDKLVCYALGTAGTDDSMLVYNLKDLERLL